MSFPASNYVFSTFEEALDDLIEDWLEDEDVEDIVSGLLAKVDAMQVAPQIAVVDETKVDGDDQG